LLAVRNKIYFTTSLLLFNVIVAAQSGHYWSNYDLTRPIERSLMGDKERDFLSVRPFSLRDIDSVLESLTDTSLVLPGFNDNFWRTPSGSQVSLGFTPLVNFGAGYSNLNNDVWSASLGMAVNAKFGKNLSFYGDFLYGEEKTPQYIKEFIDSTGVFPAFGKNQADEGYSYFFPTLRLSYTPVEFFQFEVGFGKHHLGNGYRSLMLSEAAFNYPYFKIETDVWHIKYINLYSVQDGTDPLLGNPLGFRRKYTSTHYLNWAVSPRVNIGLFESIVWQASDSLSERGFDPNYLNPIIFFRPVEFSQGSADNAILGFDISYKVSKDILAYTQLVLDEFLLSEFRDGNGWWANKWGVQIGFQWFDPFKVDRSWLRAEFNVARPFTYSHGSVLQNYAHYNQPLAHQLGANFYEGIAEVYLEKENFFAEGTFMYAKYGRDPDSLNLGGDIFRSYKNPAMEYGNNIGQGIGNEVYFQNIAFGMILNRGINLRASLNYLFRHSVNEKSGTINEHVFGIKLSTDLHNKQRTF